MSRSLRPDCRRTRQRQAQRAARHPQESPDRSSRSPLGLSFCSLALTSSTRHPCWPIWGLWCSPPWLLPPSPLLPTSCPPLHFRALPGVSAAPGPPSAAPSDRNKKSSSGIASTLGLKKFFLALGQGTRPKLGKSRSYSVEQLQPPAPGPASHTSTPKVKRAPSLQSLRVVSPEGPSRGVCEAGGGGAAIGAKGERRTGALRMRPGSRRWRPGSCWHSHG